MLALNYSENPDTAANGGDLGFIPQSALDKVTPELRKMILAMQPGNLSEIIKTSEGYRILKVFSKEPSGQRPLTDPRVQQTIRDTLRNRKDQLLKNAYYEAARNEAKVVNYLAKSVVDAAQAKAGK
jgi:peptidyl-prolyl cis-trans isomerase SurA